MKMRIVAVTNQFPLPLDSGGPLRFHGLTKALAAAHDVHLLAQARPNTTQELVLEMGETIGGPVEVFRAPPMSRFASRWARALASGMPTYVRAQYSDELAARLGALGPGADAVVFLDDYAAGYTPVVADATPVIVDKSNVLGWSITCQPAPAGLIGRLHRALAVSLIRRFERGYLRRAAAVIVTSDEEGSRLERLYGRRADAVVPSAVEVPPATSTSGPRAVAWLGDHRYPPNVEGLVRFVEEGWEPLGREGCRLLVAGRSPPLEVRALERFPGVELVGFVEDLDDLFERVSAGVVPLWRGAGVKLKTLVFMAAGVPVAGTPVAFEGVEARDGVHCLEAGDPAGLAAGVGRLLEERTLGASIAAAGRRLVEERYTWETVGPRFVEAVERAARAAHPVERAVSASTRS